MFLKFKVSHIITKGLFFRQNIRLSGFE